MSPLYIVLEGEDWQGMTETKAPAFLTPEAAVTWCRRHYPTVSPASRPDSLHVYRVEAGKPLSEALRCEHPRVLDLDFEPMT